MEEVGNLTIPTQLQRFQASIQTPLPFIKHAGEQDNRRPEFIGYIGRTVGNCGGSLQQFLPCPQLPLARVRVAGAVEIQAGNSLASDPVLLDQPQQRFLDRHMEDILQLESEISGRGLSAPKSPTSTSAACGRSAGFVSLVTARCWPRWKSSSSV